jgi:superkiller protein 3
MSIPPLLTYVGAEEKEEKAEETPAKIEKEIKKAEIDIKVQRESEEHNQKGMKFFKQDKSKEAIKAFEKAVKINPKNKEALKNLGISYSWAQRQEDAIEIFKRLIEVAPDYNEGYRNLVLIYNMQGLYKEAIPHGEKALALKRDDYAVIGYLSYDHFAIGNYHKAIIYAERLLERDPSRPRPYRILAMSYVALGQDDKAEEAFEKSYGIIREASADKDAPEKKRAMTALFKEMKAEVFFREGNRFIEEGDQVKSIESYKKSIRLNPKDFRPYYNLARIYTIIKESAIAVENLDKAIGLNPGLLDQIMRSTEFDPLKKRAEFKEMVKRYRK